MKGIALGVAAILTVSGCAVQPQKNWYKNDTTQEQFRRDHMACRQYGMQSAQTNGLAGNAFVEMWIGDETATCLKGLGYVLQ